MALSSPPQVRNSRNDGLVSDLGVGRAGLGLAGFRIRGFDLAGRARKAVGVQDHDHAAVAQDGIADIEAGAAQDRRHRLDHDFLGVENPVHNDAECLGADLGHDHEAVARSPPGFEPQHAAQRHQRQQPVAQAQHGRGVDGLDAGVRTVGDADQLDHIQLRNGETLLRRFDDQGGDDRQGQRDLDQEGGAAAGDRTEFDRAADTLDIGAHHVHARRRGPTRWSLFRRSRSRDGR